MDRERSTRLAMHVLAALAVCGVLVSVAPSAVGAANRPYMVRDIAAVEGSDPRHLVVLGDTLFFTAGDHRGRELWRSDGTRTGTFVVKDINPGPDGSEPYRLSVVDGVVYFIANDGRHGFELWRSDGTAAGTRMMADLSPGPESSFPTRVTEAGGRMYFFRQEPRVELWTTDGTANGTRLIEQISAEYPSWPQPRDVFAFAGRLWFTTSLGPERPERQWVSNGTALGTRIFRGKAGLLNLGPPVLVGGAWYFAGTDAQHGTELWRSTGGTLATAHFVADTDPRSNTECGCPISGSPAEIVGDAGGLVFFSAGYTGSQTADGEENVELWRSNGTAAGTVRLKDIFPGSYGSYPTGLVAFKQGIAFLADDSEPLWKSDGTAAGTQPIRSNVDIVKYLTNVSGVLVFHGTSAAAIDAELWRSDGTTAGTFRVLNIDPEGGSRPKALTALGNALFFTADDGVHGRELWRYVP